MNAARILREAAAELRGDTDGIFASPPVALALADWLDHEVEVMEHYDLASMEFAKGRAERSLAVAKAVLG